MNNYQGTIIMEKTRIRTSSQKKAKENSSPESENLNKNMNNWSQICINFSRDNKTKSP